MSTTPPAWPASSAETFVDALLAWIGRAGASRYDEAVTQTEHALQCAWLAQRAGADGHVVAAALLHDVGHLLAGGHDEASRCLDSDLEHEIVGARWLERMFPPEVTRPVRDHVAAKRYLCSVDAGYHDRLSAASRHSFRLQGGPLSADELRRFETDPGLREAIALRRRDDGAKVPGREVPGLDAYRELLVSLVRMP